IEGMSSFLYSPEQLRFEVCPPHYADGEEQAKCALAGMELNGHTRASNLDIMVGDAVTWALVKGKCFVELLWGPHGLEPYVVQPEVMGVMREDICELNRQEAFFKASYLNIGQFGNMVRQRGDGEELIRKAQKYVQ